MPPPDLCDRFHQAMLDIYESAGRLSPPYHPSVFRRKVFELGGKAYASDLLAKDTPSSGFTELCLRGRENLKISVEYLVLQDPWRQLFSPEELAVARQRLHKVGCELPLEDTQTPQGSFGADQNVRMADQSPSQIAIISDLKAMADREIPPTTRDALVNARLGQGSFRLQVLRCWDNRCAVTRSVTLDAIRASHIKPWRDSTDEERLDPDNGLPLIASLDALFDAGLISFEASGKMIVSSELSESEQQIFGICECGLIRPPTNGMAKYLFHHREQCFRK